MRTREISKGAKQVLALVYDLGAADPVRIYAAAKPLSDLLFVCDLDRPHVAQAYEQLKTLGSTLDITGMSESEVCDAVAAFNPAGVLTLSEHQIVLASAIAARCGLPFHDLQTSVNLTDKLRQREAMAAAGMHTPRCVSVSAPDQIESAALRVGMPAVVKPRGGAGSVDTCSVRSVEECVDVLTEFLNSTTEEAPEFVIEELLIGDPSAAGSQWGDYVSVESVTQDGLTQLVGVTGKMPLVNPFREGGYVFPSTISGELIQQVVEVEQAALRAIGVTHGVTHTEIKLTPEGPRVIEVNGRHGGYVGDLLQRSAGYDLVRAAIMISLGRTVRVPRILCRQIAFQYFISPPFGATRVESIEGIDQLAEIPGVAYVEVLASAGKTVHWRDGTRAYIGIVYGSASTHEDVLQVTKAVNEGLRVSYSFD